MIKFKPKVAIWLAEPWMIWLIENVSLKKLIGLSNANCFMEYE